MNVAACFYSINFVYNLMFTVFNLFFCLNGLFLPKNFSAYYVYFQCLYCAAFGKIDDDDDDGNNSDILLRCVRVFCYLKPTWKQAYSICCVDANSM